MPICVCIRRKYWINKNVMEMEICLGINKNVIDCWCTMPAQLLEAQDVTLSPMIW